jgi:acetoin utilization protein AcuB
MTAKPVQVQESDTLQHALRLMDFDRYRHLPVVSRAGQIVGMISDRDLRTYTGGLEIKDLDEATASTPVSRIMSRPVVEISQDEELREAARRMLDGNVGALAVVADEKLVGVISYTDVLKAYIDEE